MAHMHEQRRQRALDSYLAGAPIEDICREVAGSKSWRYQWRDRSLATDPAWSAALSRRPRTTPPQTPQRITQIVVALRQTLAQHGKDCGAAAIQQALAQQGREPVRNTAKVTLSAQVIGIRQLGDLLPSAYFACPYIASGRVSSGDTFWLTGGVLRYCEQTLQQSDHLIELHLENTKQYTLLLSHPGSEDTLDAPRYATNAARVQNRDTLIQKL